MNASARRTLETLDWPFVLQALASLARTAAGRRVLEDGPFLDDIAAIDQRFDAIDEVVALAEARAGAPPVGGVEDIAPLLEAAARGEPLDLAELRAAGATLAALAGLRTFLRTHASTSPTLARLGADVDPDARLVATFARAFDEHGALSEATYPLLGELRRRIAGLERRLRSVLEQVLESPEYADLLQERYVTVRDDRFVVPIKAHAKGLGLGIVHDASRTGQTVFLEPGQAVPIGNEKRLAEAALRAEEQRILGELSSALGEQAHALGAALDGAASIDAACARAELARRLRAVRPAVRRESVVELREARHPVLALGRADVVANHFSLTPARPVLVLSGPNAGGKTVAMKTVGLCALLVRSGCFVPAAPGSRVDLFDPILADIGDMQTVHEGLSSFSAHLTSLRAMLEAAGPGTLLLLDELASGTDAAQGGALARAVLERLAGVGARVVATTHHTQVKAMAADDARVEVAALEYRDGRPTYRVVPGTVGESHALAAARRIGIDEALIERARELMDAGERALHDALAALEAERDRAAREAARVAQAAADLALREDAIARRERTVEAKETKIRGRARELEQAEARALLQRLRAADEEVRAALSALQRSPGREEAAAAREAITAAREVATPAPPAPVPLSRPLVVGDRVRVLRLGAIGDVVALRDDALEVRAGAMTMRVRTADVELVGAAPRAGQASGERRSGEARPAEARAGQAVPAAPQTVQARSRPAPGAALESSTPLEDLLRTDSNTLDLRGVRVEEGLELLANFLDESLLAGRDAVFVLHGHGTGAMKAAVRRALGDSRYVASSAPAADVQGGDALTVARLRG